jgi:lysozyme
MANNLTLSKAGLERLIAHEGSINGLYDDPAGYATFGVGHLVHSRHKAKSVLLATAQADGLCAAHVKMRWAGTAYQMPYLAREAVAASEFEQLKAVALERALAIVARARYQMAYKDLSMREKVAAKAAAEAAVAEEARLLALTVDEVLAQDVRPFECAVNELVIAVVLLQDEFDALVSFVFNVGISAFKRAHLLKLINENRYRAGTAAERNQAIDDIAKAFAAWNTAAGKVLDGLTRRRRAEADLFLKPAREALAALRRTPSTAAVVPIAPNPAPGAR